MNHEFQVSHVFWHLDGIFAVFLVVDGVHDVVLPLRDVQIDTEGILDIFVWTLELFLTFAPRYGLWFGIYAQIPVVFFQIAVAVGVVVDGIVDRVSVFEVDNLTINGIRS